MHTLPRFRVTSLIFLGAWLVLLTGLARPADASTLSLSPSSIWAGNIVVGQSATLSTTLKNSGPSTVTVSKATSNNTAYTISSPKFPLSLASGKSVTVTLKFAPKSAKQMPGSIAFASNASNSLLYLPFNGWGITTKAPSSTTPGKLAASYGSLSFGTVKVGSTATLSQTLTNTGSSPVTISSANSNGAAFGRTGITPPITLAPNQKVTFSVFFRPVTSGAASGSITVVSNGSNSSFTIPLTGTGTSQGVGTLSVTPTSANMGSVTVGSSKTTTATLTASGSSVVVSSATTTSSEFTLSGATFPLTIAAGKTATLTVKFAPTSSGAASGKLSFISNATNSPAVQTVTGTGAAASAHHVTLAWKSSTTPVAGYNVYRGTKSGGAYTKQNSSLNSSVSFTDSAVASGATYYYVVTGVDSTGMESKYSSEVKAVVPSP